MSEGKLTDTVTFCDKGLVGTVPTEVYLAYESRAKSIVGQYAPNAPYALKNAILRAMLDARLSGAEGAQQ